MIQMKARFAGHCSETGKRFKIGATIYYNPITRKCYLPKTRMVAQVKSETREQAIERQITEQSKCENDKMFALYG